MDITFLGPPLNPLHLSWASWPSPPPHPGMLFINSLFVYLLFAGPGCEHQEGRDHFNCVCCCIPLAKNLVGAQGIFVAWMNEYACVFACVFLVFLVHISVFGAVLSSLSPPGHFCPQVPTRLGG